MIENTGKLFSENVYVADTIWTRFKGLMGKKYIPESYCLWINPCQQVHMMHMSFPIDVIFLDESNRVVDIHHNMQPWTIGSKVKGAKSVIECNAGFASTLKINDKLSSN